jgi:acetolactate synthase-1/3 small subunit
MSNTTVLHTLSVLVENKAGVLARVSNLFARRGYNIYSLAVAPTDDPSLSRITVVVDVEPALLEQVVKQLHKLINVIKISELDPRDSVERELMLLTLRAEPSRRHQIIELADVYGGRVEDVGHDEITLSVSDSPERLDALAELLAPYGVVSMQRTGRVALPKLERTPPAGLRVAG